MKFHRSDIFMNTRYPIQISTNFMGTTSLINCVRPIKSQSTVLYGLNPPTSFCHILSF